jgi:hypothetical protein
VLLAVLAGCAAKAPPPCEGGSACPDPSTSSSPRVNPSFPPPPRDNLTLPNATYPGFQLTECEDYRISLELPREKVQAVVPSAFEVKGLSQSTGGILVRFRTCQRTLDNASVFGPAFLFSPQVRVFPRNSSWTTDGVPNFLLLDLGVNNEGLRGVMTNLSMPAHSTSVALTKSAEAGGSFVARWVVDAPSWSASLEFPWRGTPSGPQSLERENHWWYGTTDGPFHRISYNAKEVSQGFFENAGSFTLQGDHALAQALGAGAVPGTLTYNTEQNSLLQYDGAWMVR